MARDVMSTNLIVCYSNENLDVALERMSHNNISHLPVMDERHPLRPIGMLCIEDVTNTYRSHAGALESIELSAPRAKDVIAIKHTMLSSDPASSKEI